MNIRIIQAVLDVFNHYGDHIRFDIDRFEEALNDEATELIDECYLVVLGIKTSVFDAMIFDEDIDMRGYVDYLMKEKSLKEDEALFMVSVFKTLIKEIGYYFEVPHIENLIDDAMKREDLFQLLTIAKAYFLGFGVLQDYEKAFEIYLYLYNQGFLNGAYYLGYMLEYGLGVEKDVEKALMYYRSHEDDMTNYRLGMLYMIGRYVELDDDLALEYLSHSQYEDAYFYKGVLLERQGNYAGAFVAYDKGSQLFQVECLYKKAMYLKIGLGVERNIEKAYHYFEYAYYLLHGDSAYELAFMFIEGLYHQKDMDKGLYYLHQAAILNSYDACLLLAKFYGDGQYVHLDKQMSLYYYQKANDIQEYAREVIKRDIEGIE